MTELTDVESTEAGATEVGPIDYLVVEFPADTKSFTGAMAAELATLVERNLIRVLDLLVIDKNQSGDIEVLEYEDLDQPELALLGGKMAEILALEDLENLSAAVAPGSAAGVIVWENAWATPFALAARESGGQLVAQGRIPVQAIIATLQADLTEGA